MDTEQQKVLITASVEAAHLERLRDSLPNLSIDYRPSRTSGAIPDEVWYETDILYTSFTTPLPLPSQAPRLRWVQLYSAGPDAILRHPLFQTPVIFTTTSGIHAINIAEYVFTTVLAWFHKFPLLLQRQHEQQWPPNSERTSLFVAQELYGKTMGIVGYGSIGRQIARLSIAFGMRVLALQRGTDHRDPGFIFPGVGDAEGILPERYYRPDELTMMLHECDVVVIAVPLTPKTQGLFNAQAFQAMKATAFLVNIARGAVCNEPDLIHALETNQIAGAALDVFQEEPLPSDHPLWKFPNVYISPHISGLTDQYNTRAAMLFEENLRRYLNKESLYNVVDKVEGY